MSSKVLDEHTLRQIEGQSWTTAGNVALFIVCGVLLGLFLGLLRRYGQRLLQTVKQHHWDRCFDILDLVGDVLVRALGPALVVGCSALIAFVTFTYFKDLYPILRVTIGVPFANLSSFCGVWFCFNILFNYAYAVMVTPGRVPQQLVDDALSMLEVLQMLSNDPELSLRSDRPYRWCGRCKAIKGMRTHHCSICRTCVLKMDHHVSAPRHIQQLKCSWD